MVNAGAQKLYRFRREAHERFASAASLRLDQPIPLEMIGDMAGCHKTMIHKLENGTRGPSLALALRLQELGIADPEDWHRPAQPNEEKTAA